MLLFKITIKLQIVLLGPRKNIVVQLNHNIANIGHSTEPIYKCFLSLVRVQIGNFTLFI